jgi:hypothetical protein
MGHLTRYLLKKAFQLFCFYPNCPKRLARLETHLKYGSYLKRCRILHFFYKKESQTFK